MKAFWRARRAGESMLSIILGMLTLLMAGCTMPDHMQVDKGLHPSNQDKDVRFRTTYYFRTFDYCADVPGIIQPAAIDSVYRFRLTGQSKALNQVHFEAGTLSASQIDPFGATVAFDPVNRQHYFKSQAQVQREAGRQRAYDELREALAFYRKVSQGADAASFPENLKDSLRQLVISRIDEIRGPQLPSDTRAQTLPAAPDREGAAQGGSAPLPTWLIDSLTGGDKSIDAATWRQAFLDRVTADQLEAVIAAAKQNGLSESQQLDVIQTYLQRARGQSDDSALCRNLRRGFQILGPQGWEPFDQDDRLVFAMSSSGKPLLSTLQELSGRVLSARAPGTAELILPLVEEEFRTKDAARALAEVPEGKEAGVAAIDAAIGALKGGEATP
jgi:hypothetical protein